jgi:hypothetical protein
MHTTLGLLLLVCSLVHGQQFLGTYLTCEGWFCETQHINVVAFSFQKSGDVPIQPVATIYPSSPFDQVQDVQLYSTYDSATKTYYCVVQDPSTSKSVLWAYVVASNTTSQVSVPYGVQNVAWDSNSKVLVSGYTDGNVYQLDPKTGKQTPRYQGYSPSQNPLFSTAPVSFYDAPTKTFGEVVLYTDPKNPEDDCYYFYLFNAQGQAQVSECFPSGLASLTGASTDFMTIAPGGFFVADSNALGENYLFITPNNFTVVSTVLDFQDFAGIGWSFMGDSRLFSYDYSAQMFWAIVNYDDGSGDQNPVLAGTQIPSGNVVNSATLEDTVSNLQVVY